MSGKDDSIYLLHILDAINQIEEYLTNCSAEQFLQTRLLQDGVIRQLEIIGEATKQLSLPTRQSTPNVPWKHIAGMRDKLIHQYFGVDLEAVWLTAKEDLTLVKSEVSRMLS